MSEEYRMFFYRNKLLCVFDYWEEGNYTKEKPDTTRFEEIAKTIESNFFTMDIARTAEGEFIIIELGDGQVAGIPENMDKDIIYRSIKERETGV